MDPALVGYGFVNDDLLAQRTITRTSSFFWYRFSGMLLVLIERRE
jgi:hypothetical protein